MKPPFAYYGGKTTMAPHIAAIMPEHEHYVEPFAGSLAVLLAKKPSRAETVNDLDGDVMAFWRMLRDRPRDLARVAMLTPHARAEYEIAQSLDAIDDMERARRVWVRLTQSRTNSMRKRGGWRYRHPSVCMYVDPPYLGETRHVGYAVEMLHDDAHTALADALNDCKASVILSGYNSPLYGELFDGWHRMEVRGATTLSGDTDRVEVLWSNRPIGEPDLFGGAA